MTMARGRVRSTNRRLINGLMRELYIWDRPLALQVEGRQIEASLTGIDEPEDPSEEGPRWLGLRTAAVSDQPVTIVADHPYGPVRWQGRIAGPPTQTRLAFPPDVEFDETFGAGRHDQGEEVVATFCRSGAITGPFIAARRAHIRAFAADMDTDWDPTLFHRTFERSAWEGVTGYASSTRLGDRLWMLGEIARTPGSSGRSASELVGQAALATLSTARRACEDPIFALSWAPGHFFWKDYEDYLSGVAPSAVVARFETLYTRLPSGPISPSATADLKTVESARADRAISQIAHAQGRAMARLLDIGVAPQASALAAGLSARGRTYPRAVVEVLIDGAPVGLAVFPGLPVAWNLRMTGNCIWLFPYRSWREGRRDHAYAALRTHALADEAPGVLEVVAPESAAEGTKRLVWRLVTGEGFRFFERWAP